MDNPSSGECGPVGKRARKASSFKPPDWSLIRHIRGDDPYVDMRKISNANMRRSRRPSTMNLTTTRRLPIQDDIHPVLFENNDIIEEEEEEVLDEEDEDHTTCEQRSIGKLSETEQSPGKLLWTAPSMHDYPGQTCPTDFDVTADDGDNKVLDKAIKNWPIPGHERLRRLSEAAQPQRKVSWAVSTVNDRPARPLSNVIEEDRELFLKKYNEDYSFPEPRINRRLSETSRSPRNLLQAVSDMRNHPERRFSTEVDDTIMKGNEHDLDEHQENGAIYSKKTDRRLSQAAQPQRKFSRIPTTVNNISSGRRPSTCSVHSCYNKPADLFPDSDGEQDRPARSRHPPPPFKRIRSKSTMIPNPEPMEDKENPKSHWLQRQRSRSVISTRTATSEEGNPFTHLYNIYTVSYTHLTLPTTPYV